MQQITNKKILPVIDIDPQAPVLPVTPVPKTSFGQKLLMLLVSLCLLAFLFILATSTPKPNLKPAGVAVRGNTSISHSSLKGVGVIMTPKQGVSKEAHQLQQSINQIKQIAEERRQMARQAVNINGKNIDQAKIDAKTRNLMLKAGIKPPSSNKPKKAESKKHLNFAGHVIKSIVEEEIQSFAYKVNLIGEVGEYIVENADE